MNYRLNNTSLHIMVKTFDLSCHIIGIQDECKFESEHKKYRNLYWSGLLNSMVKTRNINARF